ncbi:MAG: glycosyltransferase family 4 protein [Phycisphaeraceae bacterium]|nr:glycosyltransferase family 4 protein [Phycisphaeraceae bacterium]
MRVLYMAGPGDVIGTYRHWKEGRDDPGQVAMTYSGQFYDVMREMGFEAYVVANHHRREVVKEAGITIEHRPLPWMNRVRGGFHAGWTWYSRGLARTARAWGADVVVPMMGTHLFPMGELRGRGVRIIPSIQCVLWPKFVGPRKLWRVVHRLDREVLSKDCAAILSASEDINEQVRELTGGVHAPLRTFLPTYRAEAFAEIEKVAWGTRPFRVVYAGRIERDKGVFDLLTIARELRSKGVVFELCGNGSVLEELRHASAGLGAAFVCHGHCDRATMKRIYGRSHVVVAPTALGSVEGFNQVVVEAVLAGRPVVTSTLCPAIGTVRGAAVDVEPSDVAGYRRAIERLSEDRAYYEQLAGSTAGYAQGFYDPRQGWGAALRELLMKREDRG